MTNIASEKKKSFLMAGKTMAAFIDKTDDEKPDIKEFVALVLYLYSQTYKWEGVDYGFLKTTMREIAWAFGYKNGNTRQFQQIRRALFAALKVNFITDQTPSTPIRKGKQRPSDLLVIRFNKINFTESNNFVSADSDTLKKLFAAQPKLSMPKNCIVNVVNLWFLLSCKVYEDYTRHYSHKRMRKQLGLSDETLTDCFKALQELELFSRAKIFNPAVENFQWFYHTGKYSEQEIREKWRAGNAGCLNE